VPEEWKIGGAVFATEGEKTVTGNRAFGSTACEKGGGREEGRNKKEGKEDVRWPVGDVTWAGAARHGGWGENRARLLGSQM